MNSLAGLARRDLLSVMVQIILPTGPFAVPTPKGSGKREGSRPNGPRASRRSGYPSALPSTSRHGCDTARSASLGTGTPFPNGSGLDSAGLLGAVALGSWGCSVRPSFLIPGPCICSCSATTAWPPS